MLQSAMMSRVHNVGACDSDILITREDKISGNAALHETLVTVSRRPAFFQESFS